MDDEAQITALSRWSRGLPTPTETARLQDQEATEQRWASERRRARALKAMCLARAAVWRRFLRRRLPSDG
jgi:hypothetical protein